MTSTVGANLGDHVTGMGLSSSRLCISAPKCLNTVCHESRHPGDEPASLCTSLHALSELLKGVEVTVPSMLSSASDDVIHVMGR